MSLAKIYTSPSVRGKVISFSTIRLNSIYYRHCINLVGTDRGIYLKPTFIFCIAHPGIFLPWDVLFESNGGRGYPWVFGQYIDLILMDTLHYEIRISKCVFLKLKEAKRVKDEKKSGAQLERMGEEKVPDTNGT